jgi:hypothetical protein
MYMVCHIGKKRDSVFVCLLTGGYKLVIIGHNMKLYIAFKQRCRQKCAADLPETGILVREFLGEKWVYVREQVVYLK